MSDENKIDFSFLLVSQRRIKLFVYLKMILFPALFYLFFLLSYFEIVSFKVEHHTIIMMTLLFLIALVFSLHNADYACCIFENNIQSFKNELNDYINSTKIKIGNSEKSNGNFEDFRQNYTKAIRNENYSAVAASVFPMLGILGTFISIAISMPDFKSSDVNGLESEIAQLLVGVATAFYVSIYGIFLSLWWTYFEKRGLSRYQKIIEKFQNFSKKYFFNDAQVNQILLNELLLVNKENYELNKSEMQINNVEAFKQMSKITAEQIEQSSEIINKSLQSQNDILNSYNILSKTMKDINLNIVELTKALQKELKKSTLNANVGDYEINNSLKNLFEVVNQLNYNITVNSSILQQSNINIHEVENLEKELKELELHSEKIINKFKNKQKQ